MSSAAHHVEPAAGVSGHVSATRIFILLGVAVGLWSSFAWWSVLQERLLTRPYATINDTPQKFHYPFFLNLVSYTACVALAAVLFVLQRALRFGSPMMRVDLIQCFMMSSTLAMGTPFGYAAARYIAYPIVLTAKMCKPIPTMVVGFFYYKQRYQALKYIGVLLLTFGVLGFSLFDEANQKKSKKSSSGGGGAAASSLFGLGLCCINLVFDGYTQSSQDAIIQSSGAGSLQMMIMANGLAAVTATALLMVGEVVPAGMIENIPVLNDIVIPNELSSATTFLTTHPQAMNDLVYMAGLGAVGQLFIFAGISYFGTLTVMGLTVSRKIGSVLLSIWLHDHDMNSLQMMALVLVVIGILLDAWVGVHEKRQRQHHHGHHHHHHNNNNDNNASSQPTQQEGTGRQTATRNSNVAGSDRASNVLTETQKNK